MDKKENTQKRQGSAPRPVFGCGCRGVEESGALEVIHAGVTACDTCAHGKQVLDGQYHCSNPKYPRKKVIYRETFMVLKKLGCGGALSKRDAVAIEAHREQHNGRGIRQ